MKTIIDHTIGMPQICRDARAVIGEGLQLDLPLHPHPQAMQLLLQQPLTKIGNLIGAMR